MEADLPRLRRFALAVGSILFLYAIAGVRLADSANITLLGLSFSITRPSIFDWGLVIVCIYTAMHYWHLGLIKTIPPFRARKLLLKHEYPYAHFNNPSQARETIARLYPRLGEEAIQIVPVIDKTSGACAVNLVESKIPRNVKFWNVIENLDYTAPIWVNVVAILTLFLSWKIG